MPKVYIKLASYEFLVLMAEDLLKQIEAGRTHNADGEDLREIFDKVMAQIPEAPAYSVENRRYRE